MAVAHPAPRTAPAAGAGTARPALREERRLSDLVRSAGAGGGPILLDGAALRQSLARTDPVLYVAYRDEPTRQVGAGTGTGCWWRGDLVEYAAGTLPDGQPVRSIGHWNDPRQVELFQVLAGRVLMLIAGGTAPGWVSLATCQAGDLVAVPPGWFHLTCSPWQPSTVFNIYTSDSAPGGGTDVAGKYQQPAFPFVSTLDGSTPRLTRPAGGPPGTPPARLADPPWPPGVARPADLRRLLTEAGDDQLRQLRDRVHAASAAGWPGRETTG